MTEHEDCITICRKLGRPLAFCTMKRRKIAQEFSLMTPSIHVGSSTPLLLFVLLQLGAISGLSTTTTTMMPQVIASTEGSNTSTSTTPLPAATVDCPLVMQPMRNWTHILLGSNVTLECNVTSSDGLPSPTTQIFWSRDPDKTNVIGNTTNLTISGISTTQQGPYYCIAQNGACNQSLTSDPIYVNLYWDPIVASAEKTLHYIEGEKLNLTCNLTANHPVPSVYWMFLAIAPPTVAPSLGDSTDTTDDSTNDPTQEPVVAVTTPKPGSKSTTTNLPVVIKNGTSGYNLLVINSLSMSNNGIYYCMAKLPGMTNLSESFDVVVSLAQGVTSTKAPLNAQHVLTWLVAIAVFGSLIAMVIVMIIIILVIFQRKRKREREVQPEGEMDVDSDDESEIVSSKKPAPANNVNKPAAAVVQNEAVKSPPPSLPQAAPRPRLPALEQPRRGRIARSS